jgi:hypothetical protein
MATVECDVHPATGCHVPTDLSVLRRTFTVNGVRTGWREHTYERKIEVIKEGATLHASCGTYGCINPSHLVPVTKLTHRLMHRGETRKPLC